MSKQKRVADVGLYLHSSNKSRSVVIASIKLMVLWDPGSIPNTILSSFFIVIIVYYIFPNITVLLLILFENIYKQKHENLLISPFNALKRHIKQKAYLGELSAVNRYIICSTSRRHCYLLGVIV